MSSLRPEPELYAKIRVMSIMFPGVGPQRGTAGSGEGNMVNDAVSDMLIRIKNGYLAKNSSVSIPWSKAREAILKVLEKNGFIESVKVNSKGGEMEVKLKYADKKPAMEDVKRVSRPSLRVYAGKNRMPMVLGGMGIAIVSTPAGIMTGADAHKKGLGGEILAEVW